jgi:peptidoglycan hydrolase-like protein with peptidoglycan-binding domain
MANFPKLTEIVQNNAVINIDDADTELVKEVQTQLKNIGLYSAGIDGVVGKGTIKALADFKKSIWLAYPDLLGASVAGSLLEVGKHKVTEQQSYSISEPKLIAIAPTGKPITLPNGDTVYQNQTVVEGIPLTWGEVTKDCTRIPESNQIVANLIKTAKGFGEIRDKWGGPLSINSGYRPSAVNRAIGGASQSQHIYGLALDIAPINGSVWDLFDVCKASSCVGLGRGQKKGFVHIDWRQGSRVVFDY